MNILKLFCFFLFSISLAHCQRGFQVRIENLSGGSFVPTALSDVVWAVHTGGSPLFRTGRYATPGLKSLAEDGYGNTLLAEVQNNTNNELQSSGIRKGPVKRGTVVNFGVYGRPGDRFSFVTMFGESNDNFLATSSAGIALFDENGVAQSGDFEVVLYDAGTEVNEQPGTSVNQAPRQPRPNTGKPENIPVTRQALVYKNWTYPNPVAVVRLTITAATSFRVRITNVGKGTPLSPIAWAVSLVPNTLYTLGEKASAGVVAISQDGNAQILAQEANSNPSVLFSGVAGTGPILPGKFVEFTIPSSPASNFNFATMYGWSNDRFFATPAAGLCLFGLSGPVSSDNVTEVDLYDAGSSLNEEPGKGPNQIAFRKGKAITSLPEANVVKQALLGNVDGFTYQTPSGTLQFTIAPITDASGFVASNPNQNIYVNFKFRNMFKLSS